MIWLDFARVAIRRGTSGASKHRPRRETVALDEVPIVVDADFWRERASEFRERAELAKNDAALHAELIELAEICDEVAETIEERVPGG